MDAPQHPVALGPTPLPHPSTPAPRPVSRPRAPCPASRPRARPSTRHQLGFHSRQAEGSIGPDVRMQERAVDYGYVPSLVLPLWCTEYLAICALATPSAPLPRAPRLPPADPLAAAATAASACPCPARARARARGTHGQHVLHGPLRTTARVRVVLLPAPAALDVGLDRVEHVQSASPALSTTSAHMFVLASSSH